MQAKPHHWSRERAVGMSRHSTDAPTYRHEDGAYPWSDRGGGPLRWVSRPNCHAVALGALGRGGVDGKSTAPYKSGSEASITMGIPVRSLALELGLSLIGCALVS